MAPLRWHDTAATARHPGAGPASLRRELRRIGIRPAHHHADALAGADLILPGAQAGQCRRGAGLDQHAHAVPQRALAVADLLIADEHDAVDVLPRHLEADPADAAGA